MQKKCSETNNRREGRTGLLERSVMPSLRRNIAPLYRLVICCGALEVSLGEKKVVSGID